MSLNQLRLKLDYLAQQCSPVVLEQLETGVLRAMNQTAAAASMPHAVVDTLTAEAAYALIRHRYWIRVELFQLLLCEHLATGYRLPWKQASTFVAEAVQALVECLPEAKEGIFPANDREFLRYVFVQTMTAHDEAALVADLGLGASACALVRRALSDANDGIEADQDGKPTYTLAADAERAALVIELARELASHPETLDDYRLLYVLGEVPEEWRTHLGPARSSWLTELLLTLGEKHALSTAHWLRGMSGDGQARALAQGSGKEGLLALLEERELVHRIGTGPGREQDKWTLAPLGQDVTARAFAAKAEERLYTDGKAFLALCETYQHALVTSPRPAAEALAERIAFAEVRPVSPRALSACLQRIVQKLPCEEAADLVATVLEREPAPWLRKAALNVLTAIPSGDRVAQLLTSVARSDESQTVREAAFTALLRRL